MTYNAGTNRQCLSCGEWFSPSGRSQKFCSATHRRRVMRETEGFNTLGDEELAKLRLTLLRIAKMINGGSLHGRGWMKFERETT